MYQQEIQTIYSKEFIALQGIHLQKVQKHIKQMIQGMTKSYKVGLQA